MKKAPGYWEQLKDDCFYVALNANSHFMKPELIED